MYIDEFCNKEKGAAPCHMIDDSTQDYHSFCLKDSFDIYMVIILIWESFMAVIFLMLILIPYYLGFLNEDSS